MLVASYVWNMQIVWDDIAAPANYATLTRDRGYLGSLLTLILVSDLPGEYRTYGLSRAIQYVLWALSGDRSAVPYVFMSLSQLATAWLFFVACRHRGLSMSASLAGAVGWLLPALGTTWCFHHYSYLVLPVQLAIVAWSLVEMASDVRIAVAMALGVALALTGEMHVVAVAFGLVVAGLARRQRKKLVFAATIVVTMLATIAIHRTTWTFLTPQADPSRRFQWDLTLGGPELLERTRLALASIGRAAVEQAAELGPGHWSWDTLVVAALAGAAAWLCTRHDRGAENFTARTRRETEMALVLLASAALMLLIYVAVAVFANQIPHLLPRRYGLVPFALLAIAVVLILGAAVRAPAAAHLLGIAMLFGSAYHFHFESLPEARRTDRALSREIQEALARVRSPGTLPALLFVADESDYSQARATGATAGPLSRTWTQREIFESPYATYWTAQRQLYGLGASVVGMPKWEGDRLAIAGQPFPRDGAVDASLAVVVANLELDGLRDDRAMPRVFRSLEEFAPHHYSKVIRRGSSFHAAVPTGEWAVDLGRPWRLSGGADPGAVLPDRRFDQGPQAGFGPLVNYGWMEGNDAIYSNPGVASHLDYHRTNRNGSFTYGFELSRAGPIAMGFDFWEQWGRKAGQRRFKLEISWDGGPWSLVALVDPAGINGNEPFSIEIFRQRASHVRFRLAAEPGSIDIPFLNGFRIRPTETPKT